jgi:hypothetical protein
LRASLFFVRALMSQAASDTRLPFGSLSVGFRRGS